MRDNSIVAFFALVRVGLFPVHGEGFRVNESLFRDVEWGKIYQLAQEQSVLGLVLAGLEHSNIKPPKVLLLQWIGEVQQIEQRNKAMNLFIADLVSEMQKADIYSILLKGQGVAQCYERPLWRGCGDVDFLLDDDNFVKAQQFLYSISSQYELELKEEKHQEFTVESWIVELHGNQPSHFSKKTDRLLVEIQEEALKKKNKNMD